MRTGTFVAAWLLFFASVTGGAEERDARCVVLQFRKAVQYASAAPSVSVPVPVAGRFRTVELSSEYRGEDLMSRMGNRMRKGVTYLYDPADREMYKVSVRDGRLFWSDGVTPVDTGKVTRIGDGGKRAIFVMDADGTLYVSPYQKKGEFHHSTFLAGGPVASAGEIEVENGRIVLLTDSSGHYKPGEEVFRQILRRLEELGLDPAAIEIRTQRQSASPVIPAAAPGGRPTLRVVP